MKVVSIKVREHLMRLPLSNFSFIISSVVDDVRSITYGLGMKTKMLKGISPGFMRALWIALMALEDLIIDF